MILRAGMRATLVTGPDGHRFLVEERLGGRERNLIIPDGVGAPFWPEAGS
jgi:hypothetical protein